jgi:hypothetical protein
MHRNAATIGLWVAVVGLLGLSGCARTAPAAPDPSSSSDDGDASEVRDTWDVYFLQGKRVGYGHTTVRRDVEGGQPVLRAETLNHLAVKRDGQTTEENIRSASVETPQGRLIRYQSEMSIGPSPIRTTARVDGNRLVFDTTVAGSTTPSRTSIPWSSDCMGPLATEQTLWRRPMQLGERRTLKTLMIGLNQVAEVEMVAKDFESTSLLGGAHDLLRIETLTRLADGQKLLGTVWANRTGETLKTSSQALALETHRASKAEALDKADVAELDLLASSIVKVARPLPRPHQTKEVRYRVRAEGSDPASVFVTDASQAVKSIDAQTAEVTVYAVRPGQPGGNADAPPDPPTEDDLRPNNFIQSDDPTVVTQARKAAGDESDPWRAAVALEQYVHRAVTKKNYSQAFASAAEVAKSLEGDCTEHAVFLAALCRARDIPARVATGLVYLPDRAAFGYHMWTQVYVDKRWIPLDGTLGQGGIGAAHLEIARSSLKGASAYTAFLPVVQILGRLSIEIVDVK